jgi:hypothetical protein
MSKCRNASVLQRLQTNNTRKNTVETSLSLSLSLRAVERSSTDHSAEETRKPFVQRSSGAGGSGDGSSGKGGSFSE